MQLVLLFEVSNIPSIPRVKVRMELIKLLFVFSTHISECRLIFIFESFEVFGVLGILVLDGGSQVLARLIKRFLFSSVLALDSCQLGLV